MGQAECSASVISSVTGLLVVVSFRLLMFSLPICPLAGQDNESGSLKDTYVVFPQEYRNNLSKLEKEASDVAVYTFIFVSDSRHPNFCVSFNKTQLRYLSGLPVSRTPLA